MCIKPITIKNPLYYRSAFALSGDNIIRLNERLKSKKEFIEVPCGTCPECRKSYYSSLVQRCIGESLTSYVYFVTLTYDNKHLPSIILPNGEIIYYSDYEHIKNMFKRLRKNNIIDRDFRYLCVTEYGSHNHRPHFHLNIFVAKKDTDAETYPFTLEQTLFDNLHKYFSVNIGTRFNPIYEPLFTYHYKYKYGKLYSNYFVKYINASDTNSDELSLYKSINYIVGYMNKGSQFDSIIYKHIKDIDDKNLKCKLRSLLSRARYSKGLGLGYIDGHKYECSPIYRKISSYYVEYLTYKNEYPDTFNEFIKAYPEMLKRLNNFLIREPYKHVKHFSYLCYNDLEIHFILNRYFPKYIDYIYIKYYRNIQIDKVSYYFTFIHNYNYHYKHKCNNVSTFVNSPISEYIREGLFSGVKNGVPYLCFALPTEQRYTSLCKFYRERFTTFEDIIYLYDALGVKNYDDYIKLFDKYVNTFASVKTLSNDLNHDNEFIQNAISYVEPITTFDKFYTCKI